MIIFIPVSLNLQPSFKLKNRENPVGSGLLREPGGVRLVREPGGVRLVY